ncbi:MAG: hypothetical protein Q8916_07055 [Bacteroidota bacterium]|nr:hypothetical protein [Bacteroidota bacterium]MDP4230149.1 hypothetical protein [Bacteroidota bacterium]MDP4235502.1 hypothetical protein [Bacteroidota bacterium]
MTLLEEFIYSLSKSGRSKIRSLQFRGVKRKIFSKVINGRTRNALNSEAIIARYRLPKKRYYHILSELLDACYHDIVPRGGTALLLYLGNKQLFRHFFNEMKKQEAVLIESNNRHALELYYFRVLLERNLLLLHPKFNEEIVAEFDAYAKRYMGVQESHHPDDGCYLQVLKISRHIGEPLQGFSIRKMAPLIEELEDIFEQVKKGEHILAKYAVSNTLMMVLSRFHFADKSPAPYAAFGLQLIKDYPAVFAPIKDFYELECLQFISADEKNTIALFKHYLMTSSKHLGPSLYYIGSFVPKILRSGDYAWVLQYMAKYFPYNIDLLRDDVAIHYRYIEMITYVYAGRYSDAEFSFHKAFAANTGRNRNVNSDLLLRCYDVFFVAMRGDPLALEKAVDRQIRYAQRHGYERGETYQIVFLKAVGNLVKTIGFDTQKAAKTKEKFFSTSGAEHLGFLFQRLYEKYFPSR